MPDLAMNKAKYPDATPQDMPELASPEPGSPEAAQTQDTSMPNPVIGAFQTIATAILAQQEKGNPQAQAMMDTFKKLLETFGAGAGAGGAASEAPSQDMPPEPGALPPPPSAQKPMGGPSMSGATAGASPMMAGPKNKNVPMI